MKGRIVLIDDEVKLLQALKKALELEGFEVYDFADPQKGFDFICSREIDLVISDIRMSGLSGIELLGRIKKVKPELPCILMTAYSSVETAVTAIKLGARDYLLKPFELAEFKQAVYQVFNGKNHAIKGSVPSKNIIGSSEVMHRIHEVIASISDTSSTVLIYGESGTGKEMVARAIHENSLRSEKPFVPVNCSTIPEQLFESEMFGHKKGSFTNAYNDKHGLFKEAEGGTLFLDEIGDLPISNQAKLLRVLQDGSFKPVGSNQQLQADVRIIAATNKVLDKEVQSGNFREDLLYRIKVVEIGLPPLRQRRSDIKELAEFFISFYALRHSRNISGCDESFLQALHDYDWPGNVRQLENCIERSVIMKRTGRLTLSDLNLPAEAELVNPVALNDQSLPLDQTIERIEENLILQALEVSGWNYSKAAATLGVTRQNLHYKLKKYGIRKDE
ncbi:MAG TPA: sigma-54 dependent transcriptional regulator [Candidatus Rifleibacterium sp.]|nr:sigma-54 dependent transcriptional regulator [Candidatus Rifleibacterium sp.]HPT44868.1 sigma-54 dependent transcriptional regulator [Candidatus Rifleibacterium sp.]